MEDEYVGSLDDQTRLLQRELSDIGVVVSDQTQSAPTGAKSAELFAFGSFAMAVIPKLIPPLVHSISEWLSAREKRKVRLRLPDGMKLELTGPVAVDEIIRLINASSPAVERKE